MNIDDIELRHLRYFVAVAEELHFGRAAQRLHIAQPPLSQQIRKLEETIGHPLLLRTSRNVRLTAAGEELLKRAQQTLRKVSEDVHSTRRIGRGEVGTLTVGFIASSMLTVLPRMLSTYRRQFPEVELRLREFYTSSLLRALRDGTADIGFTRDAGADEDDLHTEILLPEPYIAVVPAHHPLAQKTSIRVSDLRTDPFVLFSADVGMNAWDKVMRLCQQDGFRPKVVQEAPHWLSILRLVSVGLGVTIAPACVEKIADEEVRCLRLRNTRIYSHLELAYREEMLTELEGSFLTLARETFKNTGHRKQLSVPRP
ncbi:MAG TPA: LysR substrate-binding domain-containing protein [Pseudacidobacterium sp.]|jgi:DNA-binding transcriptional LysR family regulator|nr:LysR substrate-binding domain-containing protein [Pseudacidobacterium sp.]